MLNSLFSAFLMYSRIPVPQVEWKEENRRYALCFFPLVGVVTGVLFLLWHCISSNLGIGSFLKGAVSLLITIAVTGGIHHDGFCDVSDAVTSYGDRQKRLDIMKDPHVGAFAVISIVMCMLITAAVYSEVEERKTAIVVAVGFVLSRALSGLCAVCFKGARTDGALQSFVKPSHRNVSIASLLTTSLAAAAVMICTGGATGLVSVVSALALMGYYRISSYRRFGGITGDTAGWFLVLCETVIATAAVFTERITEVAGIWS